jgi:tetratricopeptide (TPR) repeat protein
MRMNGIRRNQLALLIVLLVSISGVVLPQTGFLDRQPPPVSDSARQEMEARLRQAEAEHESNPNDPDKLIWLGRRLAYLGRFRQAIDTFSKGIAKFPQDARFYRHRGHRHITVRQFDQAIADLEKAAKLTRGKPDQVEPDGQPNARNIPTSTLQFNIWYHLGLAYYLINQNEKALKAYRECLKVSRSPDRLVATSHWLYMTLRRMKRESDAAIVLKPISEGMDVIENTGYYRLLLMYKGIIPTEVLLAETLKQENSSASHSVMYGIGNWYLYNGRRNEAVAIYQKMLASDQWTSFGYIAAEADIKRLSAG